MIKPTVGRIVIFHQPGSNPAPALITYVHSDRMINVGGFDAAGAPFGRTSVMLQQPEEAGTHPLFAYASWPERAAASDVSPDTYPSPPAGWGCRTNAAAIDPALRAFGIDPAAAQRPRARPQPAPAPAAAEEPPR